MYAYENLEERLLAKETA